MAKKPTEFSRGVPPLLLLLLVLSLATLLSGIGVAAAASHKQPGNHERLDKGEILLKLRKIKGYDVPGAYVQAVIDAPPAKVWRLIDRCANYTKTMTRVKKSKEISRKGNIVHCEVLVDLPWPLDDLNAVTRAVHTIRVGTYYQRKWTLVRGDYKVNHGSWTLTPFDKAGKRTLVVYDAHAVPNISIPKWIQRAAAKRTFPKLMTNLRAHVKKK